MAEMPADSSPQTSEFENVSPETSGNFGESDWTEADDSSVAEPSALVDTNTNIASFNHPLPGQTLFRNELELKVHVA